MPSKTSRCFPLPAMVALVLAGAPGLAYAHPGHFHTSGLSAGLSHPIGGFDHVLAMASVGALGLLMGGRALFGLPVLFLSTMVVGGLLGAVHVPTPLIEAGIITSVVVLTAMLARTLRPSAPLVVALVALSALFHGYAHGAEMPPTADGLGYGVGFLLATGALHAVGAAGALAIRTVLKRHSPPPAAETGL